MRGLSSLLLLGLLLNGCAHSRSPVSAPAPRPRLQLRLVLSATGTACHASALTTPGPGTACAWDGASSYVLGPSLGDLVVTHARLDDNGLMAVLDLELDEVSGARFADLSGRSVGRQVAVLLGGRVATSPMIESRITGGGLQITGPRQDLAQVAAALHASSPAPADAR